MILETKPQNSLSSGISKMWSAFLELSKLPQYIQNFTFIKQNENCRNLNEIFQISGNNKSTKKADPILEMPSLEEFCDYYLP